MKSCALCLFVAFLPAAVLAQDAIRIEEVGLQGFYAASAPTRVRIHIRALAQTETIQLELTVNSGSSNGRVGPLRTDRFRKHIQVTSGEPVEIEAPILLPGANQENLHVAVTDSRGRKIGEDNLELRALKPEIGRASCRERV